MMGPNGILSDKNMEQKRKIVGYQNRNSEQNREDRKLRVTLYFINYSTSLLQYQVSGRDW
jgi:hypothetical protein